MPGSRDTCSGHIAPKPAGLHRRRIKRGLASRKFDIPRGFFPALPTRSSRVDANPSADARVEPARFMRSGEKVRELRPDVRPEHQPMG